MPESIQHHQLVQALKEQVQMIVPPDCWGLIQTDAPDSLNTPFQTTEGYRPDMYYCFEKLLVIGEAKTSSDIETKHSRAQYESYIKECSRFDGQAFLVLAVPILERASMNNILQNIKKKIPGDYKTVVKGWLGGTL